MNEEHQRLLREMLEAHRAHAAATAAQHRAWEAYLRAQSEFMGKFAKCDYPLGPFVVGDVLIEHEMYQDTWPPSRKVFDFSSVIRCPTSE